MKRDTELLIISNIVRAADRIKSYRHGMHRSAFNADARTRDAIERQLGNIGEAAATLSPAFKVAHPSIRWKEIVGMRNHLLHRYWSVNPAIIWDTIKNQVPALANYLERELKRARRQSLTKHDDEVIMLLKARHRRSDSRPIGARGR